jgi:hypothetical protein
MNVQERVMAVVRTHQPLRSSELEKFLPDLDHIDVDVCIRALMRANKVSLTAGYYDLVEREWPQMQKKPIVAIAEVSPPSVIAPAAPPTAAEEASSALQEHKAWCSECKTDHLVSEFRQRSDGSPYKYCKKSHGQRMQRARHPSDEKSESTPIPPQQAPIGSQEPPATSSEHLSDPPAHGTQPADVGAENPEALSPVFAGAGIAAFGRKRDELVAHQVDLRRQLDEVTQQLQRFDAAVLTLHAIVPEAFR